MLVVLLPEPDSGVPLQGLSGVEGPAENPVGGGAEGNWEGEGPVEDSSPPGRRKVGRAVLGLLPTTDVGRRVPAEEDAVSEVSEAELREFLGELEAGAKKPGAGVTPLFLPTPDFMATAGTV